MIRLKRTETSLLDTARICVRLEPIDTEGVSFSSWSCAGSVILIAALDVKLFSGLILNVNGTLTSLMVVLSAGTEISISENPPAVV